MQKRKPRRNLRRPGPSLQPYDRVLVLCEGTKTEPQYLHELLNYYKLSTANIEVMGTGVTPDRLVARAIELSKSEKRKRDAYDTPSTKS